MSQKRSAGQGRRPSGTPASRGGQATKVSPAKNTPDYPGKRFGLPRQGSLSVAPMSKRMAALLADWIASLLIVSGVTRHSILNGVNDPHYFSTLGWTLALFAAEVYLLTAISGFSFGKRLLSIKVMRTSGGRPGFAWAAVRTGLLLCVVPALLSDRDLRGMHDRAADTIVVNM